MLWKPYIAQSSQRASCALGARISVAMTCVLPLTLTLTDARYVRIKYLFRPDGKVDF
jgi:hypothetical protein